MHMYIDPMEVISGQSWPLCVRTIKNLQLVTSSLTHVLALVYDFFLELVLSAHNSLTILHAQIFFKPI